MLKQISITSIKNVIVLVYIGARSFRSGAHLERGCLVVDVVADLVSDRDLDILLAPGVHVGVGLPAHNILVPVPLPGPS